MPNLIFLLFPGTFFAKNEIDANFLTFIVTLLKISTPQPIVFSIPLEIVILGDPTMHRKGVGGGGGLWGGGGSGPSDNCSGSALLKA